MQFSNRRWLFFVRKMFPWYSKIAIAMVQLWFFFVHSWCAHRYRRQLFVVAILEYVHVKMSCHKLIRMCIFSMHSIDYKIMAWLSTAQRRTQWNKSKFSTTVSNASGSACSQCSLLLLSYRSIQMFFFSYCCCCCCSAVFV